MFSNNLSSIDGISIFPIIALIIFVTLFTIVVVRLVTMKKEIVHKLKNIPLDEEELKTNSENKNEK